MKPLRISFYPMFLAVALGGAAISSAATPATSNDAKVSNDGDYRHRGGPDGTFHRVLDQLDLTAQQKTQVRTLFDQAKPQLQAVHESGRANREQLVVTPPTDPAYSGQLAFAKSNAAEQIQLMSDLWSQIYAVLTPDQRAQIPGIFATERSKRDAGRASWRHQRDGE